MYTMASCSQCQLQLLTIAGLALLAPTLTFGHRLNDFFSQAKNNVDNTSQSTLRLVHLVVRHGDRSPQSTYPNDPYKDDPMEPYGWGQLTKNGRINQYNQGLYLRRRYGDFLGTSYSPEIFWLQSTSADRAKMSALLEAAALWQPNHNQSFKSDLAWQPAVLNYQTRDKDDLLLIWSTCPDYARRREGVLKSPEILAVNEINRELYDEIEKHSGQSISNPDDVFDIYSTLEAQRMMNLKLPKWTREYFPDKMEKLSSLSLKMNVYNESLLKLKSAPLLSKIISNMLDVCHGTLTPSKRKMFMYVGHDSTIVNLLEGLKVWDEQIPSYNTMTMIELHQGKDGYNVQLFLKNSTGGEPHPLTIPGCDFACPIDQFAKSFETLIMTQDQWDQECELKDPNYVPGTEPLP